MCLDTDISVTVSFRLTLSSLILIVSAGNLHLNVVAAAYTPEIEAALEPFVYELVGK
jgi:hypothetical protein